MNQPIDVHLRSIPDIECYTVQNRSKPLPSSWGEQKPEEEELLWWWRDK